MPLQMPTINGSCIAPVSVPYYTSSYIIKQGDGSAEVWYWNIADRLVYYDLIFVVPFALFLPQLTSSHDLWSECHSMQFDMSDISRINANISLSLCSGMFCKSYVIQINICIRKIIFRKIIFTHCFNQMMTDMRWLCMRFHYYLRFIARNSIFTCLVSILQSLFSAFQYQKYCSTASKTDRPIPEKPLIVLNYVYCKIL